MTIRSRDTADLFQRIPFFQQGDEKLIALFLEQASLAKLKKGQHICHEGSHCSQLAIMLNGMARVYKLGENGKEITLYRVGTGESCVLTASCILSQMPFPACAICETDVQAAIIPAHEVQEWLSQSTVWRDYIFGLVATRLSNIISVVEDVVFRRMDRRIAEHLYNRISDSGRTLQVTHQKIASDLGTSREVVSRILKEFEHDGIIKVTRGSIELRNAEILKQKSIEP